jgi:hypothetical protein
MISVECPTSGRVDRFDPPIVAIVHVQFSRKKMEKDLLGGKRLLLSCLEKDFYCLSPFEFAIFSKLLCTSFQTGQNLGVLCVVAPL